ncbi:MAG: Sigma-54 dependent transcriptional regulator [Myxococcales bacterium]|nr:Sigma-54 dependent transcriptional regulator [Myxococcales bacterium]
MGRLLLADDEPALLNLFRKVLEQAGFDVVTADDGQRALAVLEDGNVEILVTDIEMPNMTGLELLRCVRERVPTLPVIIMTGGSALKTIPEAYGLGVTQFLLKPVLPVQLVNTVRQVLARRTV